MLGLSQPRPIMRIMGRQLSGYQGFVSQYHAFLFILFYTFEFSFLGPQLSGICKLGKTDANKRSY
jgi:hypothetical protein